MDINGIQVLSELYNNCPVNLKIVIRVDYCNKYYYAINIIFKFVVKGQYMDGFSKNLRQSPATSSFS